MNLSKKSLLNSNLFYLIISSFILSSTAFYNGFPLVFNADTAMYMEAASHRLAGPDRPILYGLFLKFASLGISLWLVVFIQSLLLSIILFFYFKYFLEQNENVKKTKKSNLFFLGFIVTISYLMGGSFTSSWLMPDIFTPISILSLGLLLLTELNRSDKIIISVIAVLSISMHNSNPYICFLLYTLIILSIIFKSCRAIYARINFRNNRILFGILLIIVSQFLVSMLHFSLGSGFKSSRGGVIFLMGSLVDMGIAKKYLDENCDKKSYFICQYKDSLPSNFLWDHNSPLYKNGGWKNSEKEYTAIIKDILTTPKYLKLVIQGSAKVTVKQFFHYGTGEAYKPWPRVSSAIMANYPGDFLSFNNSIQNSNKLNFTLLNYSQTVLFILCILCYFIIFLYDKSPTKYKLLMIYLLAGLLINAWFCATFSGVFHRYQSRVVWLLPLPIFLYCMNMNPFRRLLGAK